MQWNSRENDAVCQWRRDSGPQWRSKTVPPEMNGQDKCPDQLARENVTLDTVWENGGASGKVFGVWWESSYSSEACEAAFCRLCLSR